MPDSVPYFTGVVLSYFLRVAAAYAVCWLLSRLSPSPQRRFLVWLLFLLGAAGYWLAAWCAFPLHVPAGLVAAGLPLHNPSPAPHTLMFPAGWAPALALLAPLAAGIYLLCVLGLLGKIIWQHLALRRALRHALEPSRELTQLFEQMCRAFGLRRCRLLILPRLSSPATAGWLRRSVLLPEICRDFHDSSQLSDVLYHELVHVDRRDYLWAGISDLVCCLLFFHPAVWRARQHMRVQRELACDVAVIRERPEHRADYAQSLTRFARLRMLQPGRSVGIDFASTSILGMRVRAVLSPAIETSPWRAGLRWALSLCLLVCFGLLWPMFSVHAALVALPQAEAAPLYRPMTAQAPVHRHRRTAARPSEKAAPQLAAESPVLTVLPPAVREPNRPTTLAMSSPDLGPQENGFDRVEPGGVSSEGPPDWSETRPLPRSRVSVANVVQRVATGLAQIGRQEVEREGHDHGRWSGR